jgi:hypothetical protein
MQTPSKRRAAVVLSLGGLLACGGSTTGVSPQSDASAASRDARSTAAESSCAALQATAEAKIAPVVQQNLACSDDSNCASTIFGPRGECAGACGAVTNKAGAATVQSAAGDLCEPFNAQGCPPPGVPCPFQPILCAGGTCANYSIYLSPDMPALTHGVCTALQLDYTSYGGAPDAPHDLAVGMTPSNGTLYSDPACTTPLTTGSLTIPSGSSSVAFGFMPTSSGSVSISLGGPYGDGVVYPGTAQ